MPISPDLMRTFLAVCLVCMAVLAVFYLRRRNLSYPFYLGLGLFILLVPLLGPFLVILARPGDPYTPTMHANQSS